MWKKMSKMDVTVLLVSTVTDKSCAWGIEGFVHRKEDAFVGGDRHAVHSALFVGYLVFQLQMLVDEDQGGSLGSVRTIFKPWELLGFYYWQLLWPGGSSWFFHLKMSWINRWLWFACSTYHLKYVERSSRSVVRFASTLIFKFCVDLLSISWRIFININIIINNSISTWVGRDSNVWFFHLICSNHYKMEIHIIKDLIMNIDSWPMIDAK